MIDENGNYRIFYDYTIFMSTNTGYRALPKNNKMKDEKNLSESQRDNIRKKLRKFKLLNNDMFIESYNNIDLIKFLEKYHRKINDANKIIENFYLNDYYGLAIQLITFRISPEIIDNMDTYTNAFMFYQPQYTYHKRIEKIYDISKNEIYEPDFSDYTKKYIIYTYDLSTQKYETYTITAGYNALIYDDAGFTVYYIKYHDDGYHYICEKEDIPCYDMFIEFKDCVYDFFMHVNHTMLNLHI